MSSENKGATLATALALKWSDNPWSIVVAVVALIIMSRVIKFRNALKVAGNVPGFHIAFEPMKLPGVAIPTSLWNPGYEFTWKWRNHLYKERNTELVSFVPFLLGKTTFYTNNLEIARQITAGGHKSCWIKPEDASESLLIWGMNLIAAEGDVWRKHRRIMGPAFNNELYQLVWTETLQIYQEMLKCEGWTTKDVIDVQAVQSLTVKMALLVIARCGFGFSFDWKEPPAAPGRSMTIHSALNVLGDDNLLLFVVPKPLRWLPIKRIQRFNTALETITEFMRGQVEERKREVRNGTSTGKDAFTELVRANEEESRKFKLDESELIGNVYALLFAGHETTAHSLAATLASLAYYEDIQKEVYEQIISVTGNRDLEFSDYAQLTKVLAVFYEVVRIFPAGHVLIRTATEDTVLDIPKPPGEVGSTPLPIPKGHRVIVDMVGVQRNPRYLDEPEKFKPWRWLGMTNESEQFTAFSTGPRACIGRRFATIESVAFLTSLIRDWKLLPKLKDGETKEQWKVKTLDAKLTITLGVQDVPLTFMRRT